jgi:chromosome segregation ATPase
MANTPTATDKRATIQKQIEALEAQKAALDQEAIHELKLKISDARRAVKELEQQLEELTGKPAEKPRKARRERRPSITDEFLQPQILKVLAEFGKTGMNAKAIADKLNQDPMRVRKFIASNPKVLKRTGKGVGTKFFLP